MSLNPINTEWPLAVPSSGKVQGNQAFLMPLIAVCCGMALAVQISGAFSPRVFALLPQKLL